MTKIVKTIDKVTNHENMRRYLHKKASKGGGTITADSITPELLENPDVLGKIRNWGLSDEEVLQLPRMYAFISDARVNEDLMCNADLQHGELQGLYFDGETYSDGTAIEEDFTRRMFSSDSHPEYVNYSQYEDAPGIVLKKQADNSDTIDYYSILGIRFVLNSTRRVWFEIGVDTF